MNNISSNIGGNGKIKLSVVIPVYNQEIAIIKALDSIPSRNDIEILVIDDGSTDNTWETILNYRENHISDKNIILLYNKQNMGVGYTVNKGYDNITGQYVVLLGSDDYFYTDELNKLIDTELDGTDLIYFNLIINNGDVWKLNQETKTMFCGSTKIMKKSFIDDIRNPEIRCGEDYFFYNKLLEKNPNEKFTNISAKHYNFPREGSLSNTGGKNI